MNLIEILKASAERRRSVAKVQADARLVLNMQTTIQRRKRLAAQDALRSRGL